MLGAILLAGCGKQVDGRLARAHELADSGKADSARVVLGGIDRSALDTYNRRYHDLMTIKTADKLYEKHTSDSLIASVISYFEKHGDGRIVPEAHYYGGRVYSDLGDAPRALAYFQKVLDELDDSQARLKGKTASQMGQISYETSIFSNAKRMFEVAIYNHVIANDSTALMYDYNAIGKTYMYLNDTDSALLYLRKSLQLAQKTWSDTKFEMEVRSTIIDLLIRNEDYSKAIEEFKEVEPHLQSPSVTDPVLMSSMNVYIISKQYDRAEDIAERLLQQNSVYIHKFAYEFLKKLAKYRKDVDALYRYTIKFDECQDSIDNMSDQNAIIHQLSYFNYSIYERENLVLQANKQRQTIIILTAFILLLFALLLILLYRYRIRKFEYELRMYSETIKKLATDKNYNQVVGEGQQLLCGTEADEIDSVEELQNDIDKSILKMIENIDIESYVVPQAILSSDIYKRFKRAAIDNTVKLTYDDWQELDDLVNSVHTSFKIKLSKLRVKLSDQEYRICLLIKCKFKNSNIGTLTNHGRSSISHAKKRLSKKLFIHNEDTNILSRFILSL